MRKQTLGLAAACALVLAVGGGIAAADDGLPQGTPGVRSTTDGVVDTPLEVHGLHEQQHGTTAGHIPGSVSNITVVSTLDLPRTNPDPGIITDVWSKGTFAYLGTFAPPCHALGIRVVDIADPANPVAVGFIPAKPDTRTNDVKVFTIDTPFFSGDLLLHSNENCGINQNRVGGISLWDVTNPLDPRPLAQGVGDTVGAGGGPLARARQVHNVYAWQDGQKAYAMLVDDEEILDVDILDITDPRNPVQIAETGLPDWPDAQSPLANGSTTFLHDVWVKKVGGTWTAYLSYWDAGLVLLNVNDPANPTFIADSDYPDPDPLTGFSPPEGNGHAAVPDRTGAFVFLGDEDFSPFRLRFEITSGPFAGERGAGEFGWSRPVATLPGGTLNGPIVFGGYGCNDDVASIPPPSVLGPLAPDEEAIVLFQRGPVLDPNHDHAACRFDEKVQNGFDAGYDGVIIANHHTGSGAGANPDAFFCGGGDPRPIPAICVGHETMHLLFNRTPDYTVPYPVGDPGDLEPNPGDLGPRVAATAVFDGWGYLHLIDAGTMQEIDAFAPPEVLDPAFASGFGDLTMHNVEADPDENLAYISWYSLGLRVYRYSSEGLEEVGHFIDANGNNFWGVHVADDHPAGKLILASDRDNGLWIFRYTGP